MSECPFNKVTRESFVAFTLWGPCAKETIPAVDGDYPSPSLRKSRKLKVWYRNVKHYRGGTGPRVFLAVTSALCYTDKGISSGTFHFLICYNMLFLIVRSLMNYYEH